MLKDNDFFNFLTHKNLHFRTEDIKEIQFDYNCEKSQLINFISEFCTGYSSNFIVVIDDQFLSIPAENNLVETILKTIPKDTVSSIFKFKKEDIVSHFENTNSIIYYDYNNLISYLSSLTFEDFQSSLFSEHSFLNVYIVENFNNLIYQNRFLKIQDIKIKSDELLFSKDLEILKEEIQEKFLRLSSWGSTKPIVIPEQLYLSSDVDSPLLEVFNKWCSFLCISYFSSYFEKSTANDKYIFHFNAKRKIILETTYNLEKPHSVKEIFEFYQWVYSDKTEDKMKIFHNLIPLHISLVNPISLEVFLSSFKDLVESAKENFNFFIQDNIKDYLDERKKIEDLIMSTGNLISAEINRINDLFIKTLTGVFLSIISAIVLILIKSEIQSSVSYGLYLFGLIVLTSAIYILYFSFLSTKISYDSFDERIKEYSFLFDEQRMEKIKISIIKRRSLFNQTAIITSILLITILVFIFALGMYFQNGENQIITFILNIINSILKK